MSETFGLLAHVLQFFFHLGCVLLDFVGVEVHADEFAEGVEEFCKFGGEVLMLLVLLHLGDDLGIAEDLLLRDGPLHCLQ
jgi:hypothetical protein